MAEKEKAKEPATAAEKPKAAAKKPEGPKAAYIVNPKGTIHTCDREHARERLRQGRGWRMATAAEIRALREANGFQRWDRPIAQPWAPEPEDEPNV